jgi:hypothetical protein
MKTSSFGQAEVEAEVLPEEVLSLFLLSLLVSLLEEFEEEDLELFSLLLSPF